MRLPSPYSKDLLRKLVLAAKVPPSALEGLLADIGQADFSYNLNLLGPPGQVWSDAIESIASAGLLDGNFMDALAQHPKLVHRADELDQVRVALELLPSPGAVLSPVDLKEAKRAARLGMLHEGVGHALLGAQKPLAVGRRAGMVALNKADQLDAWFDAANRQELDDGSELWMDGLLDKAIAHATTPAGKAGLQHALDRLRARIFHEAPRVAMFVAAGLEQVVQEFGITLDASQFVERMAASLARVCLVRIAGQDLGTGFLVGPDLLLTNYHVLGDIIGGAGPADDVSFTFDYRTSGGVVSEGPSVGLHTAGAGAAAPRPWLIDANPSTDAERGHGVVPDLTQPTDTDHLDFALVRLATPIGGEKGPSGATRGHFVLNPAGPPFSFPQGIPLIVVGHPVKDGTDPPKCSPQVFAIEPDSVIGVNPNNTRVRYRTNTLRGSSGSPVLSAQWELVALHHFGRKGQYNQGIPTAAIAARPAVAAVLA